ncbi:hypothetical protein JCM19233_1948 [Vibrio astriarenae]|nr:hypothetical protein JCM19233_1948 [Vibrio sp. C7]
MAGLNGLEGFILTATVGALLSIIVGGIACVIYSKRSHRSDSDS